MLGISNKFDADVLVIGAGPVGLAAAIELCGQGVNVRIIDSNKENRKLTKASGIHVRTLELLPEPVLEKLKSAAVHVLHAQINEIKRTGELNPVLDINLDGLSDSVVQGMLSLQQWRTEEVLIEYLEEKMTNPDVRRRVKVERGTKLIALNSHLDFVEAELESDKGKQSINVQYVIGCDGSHSFTRKLCRIPYPGTAHEPNFIALHASFEGIPEEFAKPPKMLVTLAQSEKGYSTGMCFSMPMPNDYPRSYLLIADLNDEESKPFLSGKVNKYGRQLLGELSPEEAFSVIEGRWFDKGKLSIIPGSVQWCTTFTVNSRQASLYRSGRIFLAGDAAHCHSPLGGQGMNMGIQDVINLSWKLSHVILGNSNPSILDTYESERLEIDKRIISMVKRSSDLAWSRSPVLHFVRSKAQHVMSKAIGVFPILPIIVPLLQMTSHSYSSCSELSFEHWERPPIWPVPISRIYPFGGYRRSQNLFRWFSRRVRAGDRLPNITLSRRYVTDNNLEEIERVYPYKRGWLLILCEGQLSGNDEMKRNLRDVDILNIDQLRTLGERIKKIIGIIDRVVVISGSNVNTCKNLGVYGQCLFVVRPDSHIGLRSEPIRYDVVLDYFQQRVQCPISRSAEIKGTRTSSPGFDPVPLVVWFTIGILGSIAFLKFKQS